MDVGAVVVLGGGYSPTSPDEGGKASLSPESMKRAIMGARLGNAASLPLLFTGGRSADPDETESEADAAKAFWLSLGIAAERIILETKSRDIADNAHFVAEKIGQRTIVLVTSAWHMPRSVLAFERAGMKVIAAPTAYRAGPLNRDIRDFLPGASALETSSLALHEYIGLVWYKLRL
ncbi:MAG: YdcF family protein [Spirochaetota bacterium]